jgi:hypothetical protein
MSKPKDRGPKVKLSTGIGRYIDKISYLKIGVLLFLIILISAFFYWILSGTNQNNISFWNSLYFSIISITTVGYGDIAPVGVGKIIACGEIITGVILMSIFIGKIASERQYTLLLLTYTSEQQRRLQSFVDGLEMDRDKIDTALTDHAHERIYNLSMEGCTYIRAISNYLVFQSNQGRIASFGNLSSLRLLYKTLLDFQEISIEAIRN